MVDDEGTGELDQAQVIGGLLLVANAEFAEAVVPAIGAFDDPAPGRVAGGPCGDGSARLPAPPLARRLQSIAPRLGRLVGCRVVEALIPTQVLRVPGGRGGALDDHAVE